MSKSPPRRSPLVKLGFVLTGGGAARRAIVTKLILGGQKQKSMQLSVRDVSKFLNVSESTVTRWIKQRGLPSRHVGGQYRFHRVELLEWATANKIRVSLEAFDELQAEDEPVQSLVQALEAGGIISQPQRL